MWIGRFGSNAHRWWNHEVHIPLPWQSLPSFDLSLHHVDRATIQRARNVFPDGDLILKGVYFTKDA